MEVNLFLFLAKPKKNPSGQSDQHNSASRARVVNSRSGHNYSDYKKQYGQGILEFALTLPVALLLILGILEFGRLIITYTAISSASREGARFGAAVGNEDLGVLPPFEDCDGIRDAAKRVSRPFIPIEDSMITIQYDKGPGTSTYSNCAPPSEQVELGDRVVVKITTTYTPIFDLGYGSFEVISEAKRSIAREIIVD